MWRRGSRALLVFFYIAAWFAPAASAVESVSLNADTPYYDYNLTLDGQTLLHVTFDSNVACPLDFETTIDPWLRLLDEDGNIVADDDDGNHNDQDNCYGSKLHLTPTAGNYVLRFRTYQEPVKNLARTKLEPSKNLLRTY